MHTLFRLGFFLFLISGEAHAVATGTGLKLSGAADILGTFGAKDQTSYPSKLEARETEFSLYGPLDHGFDGLLSFAAHQEGGEYHLELHEAYLSSSKLVQNLRIKGGKYFLGVGRLNQIHRHDWPFTAAPKAHKEFFAEEAAGDTGLEGTYLFPFLPIPSELTLGAASGWTYGHAHSAGQKPIQPTHYARWANFFSLGENGGLQTGFNYLGRRSRDAGDMRIFGLDLTAKFREDSKVKWLLQSEIYGRNLRPLGGELERAFGGYFYVQRHIYGAAEFGVRFDGYTVDTSPVKNLDYSFVPTLTYRHSEFVLFRGSYQWDLEKRDHSDKISNRVAQVQAVFLLGDHPVHDF
jgi:hypothetical protein